jgi:VanZ family protein
LKRLLLLAIALIVYGSLYPWQFDWWRTSESPLDVLLRSWPATVDRFLLRDIAINLLLYFPLGMTAFLTVARRHSRTAAVTVALLLGAVLSTSMELLQVYVPGRVSSLLDITCNFAGTLAGALAAIVLQPRLDRLMLRPSRRLAPAAALLLACWGAFQAYPFFPALSQSKLGSALAAFSHGFPLSAVEVWANAAEWFTAALAVRAIAGRLRWWWPGVALGVLIARLLIATRNVTPNEAVGLVLAALLWAAIPESRSLRAGAWSLALALVLRELAPLHFSTQAQPFSWIPFQGTLLSERQAAVVILARKAFDYGAMIWLLRKNGLGYLRAGVAVAASLFVFEMAQTHLPGRTPEITDSVLAILMLAALWQWDRRSFPPPVPQTKVAP